MLNARWIVFLRPTHEILLKKAPVYANNLNPLLDAGPHVSGSAFGGPLPARLGRRRGVEAPGGAEDASGSVNPPGGDFIWQTACLVRSFFSRLPREDVGRAQCKSFSNNNMRLCPWLKAILAAPGPRSVGYVNKNTISVFKFARLVVRFRPENRPVSLIRKGRLFSTQPQPSAMVFLNFQTAKG